MRSSVADPVTVYRIRILLKYARYYVVSIARTVFLSPIPIGLKSLKFLRENVGQLLRSMVQPFVYKYYLHCINLWTMGGYMLQLPQGVDGSIQGGYRGILHKSLPILLSTVLVVEICGPQARRYELRAETCSTDLRTPLKGSKTRPYCS